MHAPGSRAAWPPIELRLRLKLENRGDHQRTLRLPVPMLDAKAFLKLLQLDLAGHRRRPWCKYLVRKPL